MSWETHHSAADLGQAADRIDGAKFVAAAVPFAGDPWDILIQEGACVEQALPLEYMVLLWVRMVRTNGHSPAMVWAMLTR